MRHRQRQNRRGQAAVFIALILFTLVIFVAMATNIGILVNDKIRMQSAVDLATYSVAFHEAQALNKMVEKNREIADVVADCRNDLVTGYWDICDCQYEDYRAELIIERCKLKLDMKITEFVELANYETSVHPRSMPGATPPTPTSRAPTPTPPFSKTRAVPPPTWPPTRSTPA